MSTATDINSLYNAKCKTELQLKRASAELTYANALLESYKLDLFVAKEPGGLDIINMLTEELGVGSDIINELTAKANEQEDRRNKCYAIWAEIDTRYTRQTASYYDAVDTRNSERHDEEDCEYACRYCEKDVRGCQCEEDLIEEMREYSRHERRWCGRG